MGEAGTLKRSNILSDSEKYEWNPKPKESARLGTASFEVPCCQLAADGHVLKSFRHVLYCEVPFYFFCTQWNRKIDNHPTQGTCSVVVQTERIHQPCYYSHAVWHAGVAGILHSGE